MAQKNAEKVLASNAAARKQPFYGSNENQEDDMRTSPPITTAHSSTKTPATLHHQYTPAVSDGSSSGSSGSSSGGGVSSQASSEGDNSTCANTNGSGRYNLLSELDAENESSSRAGRSNKENVTPSPSTLTVGTLDTVDKILGGMSAASSASMSVGSSHEKNKQQQQVQTVNVHPYGGGKKYMVSKKALRLEGHRQWAMVGEADADCDDSSSSGDISESGDSSSASSSISSMGSQRGEAVINASTDVVHGTPASRVHQDPGELLSTTGVSFLEDASYLDGEGDKDAGLNFHNNIGLLSPVAEADATEDDGMTTPAAPAVTDYAKQIYTFTPGSAIAGGDSDASSINDDASPASIGMFDQLESEWKDASSETSSDNSSEEDEKSNDEDNNGGTSAATTFLRDASMWVLPPEQDSSDDTISNAPSDETDGNIAQTPPESTAVGGGGNNVDNDGRQVLGELSISNDDYEESENINDDDEEEDDCVATLSPNRCLRTNAIDQALEETNVYMNKISDLESALHKAVQSTKVEAQKRRDCEKRIDELVMRQDQDQDQDQPFGVQTPAGITTLDLDLMNFSAFISPPTQDVDPEEVLAEAKEDRKLEQEQEQDLSTESSEMLDARAATASLMERNETLVKEIRFADQTCVELSERNAALERDVQRLDAELEASRKAHEDLRERLEKSVTHTAKLEERASNNAQKLSHRQSPFDAKMAATKSELATAQIQISSLQSKVDTMGEEKLALVADVAAASTILSTNTTSTANPPPTLPRGTINSTPDIDSDPTADQDPELDHFRTDHIFDPHYNGGDVIEVENEMRDGGAKFEYDETVDVDFGSIDFSIPFLREIDSPSRKSGKKSKSSSSSAAAGSSSKLSKSSKPSEVGGDDDNNDDESPKRSSKPSEVGGDDDNNDDNDDESPKSSKSSKNSRPASREKSRRQRYRALWKNGRNLRGDGEVDEDRMAALREEEDPSLQGVVAVIAAHQRREDRQRQKKLQRRRNRTPEEKAQDRALATSAQRR